MAKVLVVVLSLLVASVHCGMSPEVTAQIQKMQKMVRSVCQSGHKVTDAQVDEALRTKILPTDHNFKCFLHCTLEISHMMSDDETNFETVRKQAEVFLPDDLKVPILKAIDICSEKVKVMPDKCDTAYNVAECFGEYGPDGFI